MVKGKIEGFRWRGGLRSMYVQSPAKVTDESLGARKNAKDQEHLLNYWTGGEIRQLDIQNQAC
jgi:hypothetical protein